MATREELEKQRIHAQTSRDAHKKGSAKWNSWNERLQGIRDQINKLPANERRVPPPPPAPAPAPVEVAPPPPPPPSVMDGPTQNPGTISPVEAPNLSTPEGIINTQIDQNKDAADLNFQGNNPSLQTNPYGSQEITRNPDGTVRIDQKLSPEQQALFEAETANNKAYLDLAGNLVRQYQQNPFTEQGLPEMPGQFNSDGLPELYRPDSSRLGDMPNFSMDGAPEEGRLDFSDLGAMPELSFDGVPELTNDFSADRQRVEDALYGRQQKRLDERFKQEEQSFGQSLADRGIVPGSELYEQQMRSFRQSKDDAYLDAKTNAIAMGGNEQRNLWDMALGRRQQGVGERMDLYGAGMQGRNQRIGEKVQSFDAQNQLRSNAMNERLTGFNAGMQRRTQGWGEQMDQYNTSAQSRNQMMNERQASFNNNMNRYQTAFNNRLTASRQPLEALGQVMGNYSGIKQPNFTPYQGYHYNPVDVTGTATQFAGWNWQNQDREDEQAWNTDNREDTQGFQAGESKLDRAAQWKLSTYQPPRSGGGGGRGGGGGGRSYSLPAFDPSMFQAPTQPTKRKTSWSDGLIGLVANAGSAFANTWAQNYANSLFNV